MLMAVIKEENKFNFKEVIVYALKSLIQIKQFNWYLLFTDNTENALSWGMLKRHISIGVFVVYIDTGSPVPNILSKSRGLGDENKKTFDEMEMIRNKRIGFALSDTINMSCTMETNVCIFVREFSKLL